MVITQQDKEAIAAKARQQASDHGLSQAQVATQSGVSKTIVTWMFSDDGKWKHFSISDKQWQNMAIWCEYTFNRDEWQICRTTRNFRRFYNMVAHAHEERMMILISDLYGRGKSTALEAYAKDHRNSAFYLECEPSMYQSVFLTKIGRLLGIDTPVRNIATAIDEITERLLSMKVVPIMLLDEWNELPNGSKLILKTLYNRTKGRVSWVVAGGQNLAQIFKYGVDRAKQGMQEIWSRGGGKLLNSGQKYPEEQLRKDITSTLESNGVEDRSVILETINNFNGDWRVVVDAWRNYRLSERKSNTRQLKLEAAS